ncbi:unnamed protein product [Rangifer tarandus platyrhynchus]|uniref:Uncharacterized protein n=1 Tax=Rangifer tarandus platyrhynchus TaxID=3082113 RepID=A0ABN8Y729_RANTA|nr:unnamed protein product [Rangifer tarandus platyrhynchus]
MDIHVFPIPVPPPTSLSTRSPWVFPVHQAQAPARLTISRLHISVLTESAVHNILQAFIFQLGVVFLVISCFNCVQLLATPWTVATTPPPGSSVHGILQARLLEWVAIAFSRRSS